MTPPGQVQTVDSFRRDVEHVLEHITARPLETYRRNTKDRNRERTGSTLNSLDALCINLQFIVKN